MSDRFYLSLHVPWDDYDGALTEEEMKAVSRNVGLTRWKRNIHATVPLLAAAQGAIESLETNPSKIGILSVGRDLSANHTEIFLRRAREGKPQLVNPLDFPHTLNSAMPGSIAQALGAKAFAFVLGDTPTSVFDALQFAVDALSVGLAQTVLITLCDEDSITPEQQVARVSTISIPTAAVLCLTDTPHQGAVNLRMSPVGRAIDEPVVTFETVVPSHQSRFGLVVSAFRRTRSPQDARQEYVCVSRKGDALVVSFVANPL